MVYDLRCKKCDQVVTVDHPMSEPHPNTHAGCGGSLVRVFFSPRIIYRGDGFYTTDACLTDKPKPEDVE